MGRLKSLAVSTLLLLLAACAHVDVEQAPAVEEEVVPPEPVQPADWPVSRQQRQAIHSWELRGRLGIQTEHNGGSLDINWKQDNNDYVIRMIAPMGQGMYLISGDMQSARIKLPNGKTRIIENPDAMFESALGVKLPVAALRDWVRGIPASSLAVDFIKWDEQGLLHIVDQDGWHVEMSNNIGDTIALPYKIYINREDNPDLDIRLVLRQWMVDNE